MPHTISDIPSKEPSEIVSGSTVKWKKSLSHFSAADGWVLSYDLVNKASKKISITGVANGADHDIALTAAITALYAPGEYFWQSYATKATDRYDIGSGRITIKPNFATVAGQLDQRTSAEIILDAITAVLQGVASKSQQEVRISGRTIISRPIEELLTLRNWAKSEVSREKRAEKIKQGLDPGGRILLRM